MIEMHAIVLGHVQGVFFRSTTCEYAKILGLTGTVCNLNDGSVEIYAHGEIDKLEKLIKMLEENYGDDHIKEIKVEFAVPKTVFSHFNTIHFKDKR